jgi:hypothetical protein
MEIINKASEEYKAIRRIKNGKPFISFSENGIRFFISAKAGWDWDLPIGWYAHFAIDLDRAFIFFNQDATGTVTVEHYGGLKCQGKTMLSILMDRNKLIQKGSRFLLKKSANRIQDSLTLEILLTKRIYPKLK